MPQQDSPSSNLLWPGGERAGTVFSDEAVLAAMLDVERAWLSVLVETGIAPAAAANDLRSVTVDRDDLAIAAEGAGNPAAALAALVRSQLPEPAASWLHRGLTSQDVVDSALMMCSRDALRKVRAELARQVASMTALLETHRSTPMLAHTLTQPAVTSTFGLRVAGWLTGVLDAADAVQGATARLQVQAGGAVGSLAATVELAHGRGLAEPAAAALNAADLLADRLGLTRALPWHTSRRPVTVLADALVACTDGWGRIARDVLGASRAEVGELREPAAPGRGGSSTMPGKRNPILSVLIRRAALAAPPLVASLHTAAANANDERSDGAWHVEWDTLRTLSRRAVVAGSQTTELLAGLQVDTAAMARNLAAHVAGTSGIDAEQQAMARLTGSQPADTYRGATDLVIDRVVQRAARFLESAPAAADPQEGES